MVIKQKYPVIALIVVLMIFLPVFGCMNVQNLSPHDQVIEISSLQELKTSEITLIDKVYNFTTWQSWKMLENLSFKAEYNYYVYFTIITPHVCDITITVIDPEGSIYDVYYNNNFGQENGTLFFPFGAALTGLHDILFELDLEYNLNMHVKVEEAIKCLYDVFSWQEAQNVRQYGVVKFEDSPPLLKNLVLEMDVAYTLYFARVTPISDAIPDTTIRYNYSLIDMDQAILFEINWRNGFLQSIGSVSKYSFGTAHGGPYITNLTVQYDYNPVNIAFAIVYDHKISGEIDENDTIIENTEESTLKFSIPVELTTGTIIAIVAIIFIVLGVVISKRREANSP